MSTMVVSYHLARHRDGRGTLPGGVPGVTPRCMVVIGSKAAGVRALHVAEGMNRDITILEIDFERMRFLDIAMDGIRTVYSSHRSRYRSGTRPTSCSPQTHYLENTPPYEKPHSVFVNTPVDYDFMKSYEPPKAKGFVIYPGKVTQTDSFRPGTIEHVSPGNINHLIASIEEFMYWN